MKVHTVTFEEDLVELEKARLFWGSLGYNLAATRIGAYERELRTLIGNGAEGWESLDEIKRASWFHRNSEIMDFLLASQIVQSKPHLARSSQIGVIFGGPELAFAEYSPELAHPRNIFLEIIFAAHLEAAGLPADLSGATDVKTVFNGVPIYVECKRPQNLKKTEPAIRKASQQLAQRVPPLGLGIILLCAGKILSDGDKWFAAADKAALEKQLDDAAGWVFQETVRHWQKRPSVAGLMVRISVPAIIISERRMCHTTTFRMMARSGLSASAGRLLDEFDATLHSGFPGKTVEV